MVKVAIPGSSSCSLNIAHQTKHVPILRYYFNILVQRDLLIYCTAYLFFLLRVPLHFSFQFLQRLYLPKTVLQLLDTNTKLQLGTTSKNFTFSQHQHLIINNTLKVQFFYLVMNFPKLQTK